MTFSTEDAFMIDDVLVVPSQNKLENMGVEVQLQPKVMAVLQYLAQHQSRVISNDELINALWDGRVTHASVQKSINLLRNALGEVSDEEAIKNYSKKGYQLLLTPRALTPEESTSLAGVVVDNLDNGLPSATHDTPVDKSTENENSTEDKASSAFSFGGILFLLAILSAYYLLTNKPDNADVERNHKTRFEKQSGFTSETGHERGAQPHPDNHHVVYIRDFFNAQDLTRTESQLIVRNQNGEEWQLESSENSWFKLAWAPDDQSLLAVEVTRNNGQPLSPDFYEKADYLYHLYILKIDLQKQRLADKQLITQWQGRISSVDWWDDSNIEIVAKQGHGTESRRYHFSLDSQQLSPLDKLGLELKPFKSQILNKRTAVASYKEDHVVIHFLKEDQSIEHVEVLPFSKVDIDWIPDESGVLVFSNKRKLILLYRGGERVEVPFSMQRDRFVNNLRFQPDGQAIYYTEKKYRSDIWSFPTEGQANNLTNNSNLNYLPSYSSSGEKLVYASVRNNQANLWLLENGAEQQLTQNNSEHIRTVFWTDNDKHIVYKSDDKVMLLEVVSKTTSTLLEDKSLLPIALNIQNNTLLAVKYENNNTNLWEMNLTNQKQSQRTFGSLGSTFTNNDDVYFQYSGKDGLWILRAGQTKPEKLTDKLNRFSKILHANNDGVYFLTGGSCRESDIFYLTFSTHDITRISSRGTKIINTNSFHPKKGSVGWYCYLSESNIVKLN